MSETLVQPKTTQYVVFTVEGYFFALPGQKILKVVPTPPPDKGGMVSLGLVQLEQYSIQMLNLTEMVKLRKKSDASAHQNEHIQGAATASAQNPPFLMVLQGANEALYGIAVDTPPDLIEIEGSELKPIPIQKRLSGPLQWVSHLVNHDPDQDHQTLMVLDLSRAIASQQPTLESASPEFVLMKPS